MSHRHHNGSRTSPGDDLRLSRATMVPPALFLSPEHRRRANCVAPMGTRTIPEIETEVDPGVVMGRAQFFLCTECAGEKRRR